MASKKVDIHISVRDDDGFFAGKMMVNFICKGKKINLYDFLSLSTVSKAKTIEQAAKAAGDMVAEFILEAHKQHS